MLMNSWLKNLKARLGLAPARPSRCRPHLEVLEDRCLMAATFDWSMADRFGIDQDNDGLIDMHNNPAFVRETKFEVVLNAGASTATAPIQSYGWSVRDQNGNLVSVFDASGQVVLQATVPNAVHHLWFDTASTDPARNTLREKSFYVTLDVTATTGAVTSQTQFVRVKDILIVSIGDSMASGEGNPEINRGTAASATWADTWDDRIGPPSGDQANEGLHAHRTSKSHAGLLALQLEEDDPHTSVTFVSVASSGAQITEGLLGPQLDRADHSNHAALAQLLQVTTAVGNRHIDAMTVSIGINDVHFADILSALTLIDPQIPLAFMAKVTHNGQDTGVSIDTFPKVKQFAQFGLNPAETALGLPGQTGGEGGLGNLTAEYAKLDTAMRGRFPAGQISQIFISQYPDPSLNTTGQLVPGLTDIVDGLEMDTVEGKWAREEFLFPLNDLVRTASENFNWTLVTGIPARFGQDNVFGHGYSATPLNGVPQNWVRTATESYKLQGDDAMDGLNDGVATGIAVAASAGLVAGAAAGFTVATILGGAIGGPYGAIVGAGFGTMLATTALLNIDEFYNDVYADFRGLLGRQNTTGVIHPNPGGQNALMEQYHQAIQAVGDPSYFSNPFAVSVPSAGKRSILANTGANAAQLSLRQNTLNPAFMEVVVDGFLLDAWRSDSVSQLTIDAGRAAVFVLDIPTGLKVTVNDASAVTAGKHDTVQSLQSTLTIGSKGGTAKLTVANSSDAVSRTNVQITDTKITGLSAGEIGYQADSLNALIVFNGTGNDVIRVQSTAAGAPVTVNGGKGDDTITVTYVRTAFFAPFPAPVVVTDSIKSPLNIDGGTGALDTLNVSFSGFALIDVVELTSNNLSPAGEEITYSNLDKLTLALGGLGDTVTVRGTHAGATILNTGGGNDTVNVRSVGGPTTINTGEGDDLIRVNNLAPTAGGVVNKVNGLLTINGGAGAAGDKLVVDDSGDTVNTPGAVNFTPSTAADATPGLGAITGLGMTNGGIAYSALEKVEILAPSSTVTVGSKLPTEIFTIKAAGLAFHGTDGNDDIRVSWQAGPDGAQAVFQINHETFVINYVGGATVSVFAGAGNDHVVMDESAGLRWRAEFFGDEGNDHLVGSLKNDWLDGGQGNDLLEGGAGDDELTGGTGHDVIDGGAGADRISADDNLADLIFADLDDWLLGLDASDRLIQRTHR